MLQSMKSELTTNASLMNQNDGLIELRFEHPDGFNLQSPIQYGDYEIIPQHFDADVCTGMMQDADQILPSHAIATQSTISQQPEVVAYELQQYWNQFWRRDSVADFDNPQHWNQFLELLQQHPNLPSINIDVSRADSWRDALRKTNAGKARGYDGWHIEDLKTLPDTCLQCLANIFHHKIEENSFPAFLMQNITLPMGKKTRLRSSIQYSTHHAFAHCVSLACQSSLHSGIVSMERQHTKRSHRLFARTQST